MTEGGEFETGFTGAFLPQLNLLKYVLQCSSPPSFLWSNRFQAHLWNPVFLFLAVLLWGAGDASVNTQVSALMAIEYPQEMVRIEIETHVYHSGRLWPRYNRSPHFPPPSFDVLQFMSMDMQCLVLSWLVSVVWQQVSEICLTVFVCWFAGSSIRYMESFWKHSNGNCFFHGSLSRHVSAVANSYISRRNYSPCSSVLCYIAIQGELCL